MIILRHVGDVRQKSYDLCDCRLMTAGDVSVLCVVGEVRGVTQLHDVVYIVYTRSSTISRFNLTTHQRLTNIVVSGLRYAWDIVACERTSQLYVAELQFCPHPPWTTLATIWRVSSEGADTKRWLPKSPSDTIEATSLSVTSTRLLVTSSYPQLIQFDALGDELRRVQLPDDMEPSHAVESPTGTFIISHLNRQLNQTGVIEVNTGGEVLRQFSGSPLSSSAVIPHVDVDSHGNIFVADMHTYRRILLLDAHLRLRRVIVDEDQFNDKPPGCLCYREQSGQLLVGLYNSVKVFDLSRL